MLWFLNRLQESGLQRCNSANLWVVWSTMTLCPLMLNFDVICLVVTRLLFCTVPLSFDPSWCINHFCPHDRLPLVVYVYFTIAELRPCVKTWDDGHLGDAKTGLPNIHYDAMFKVTEGTWLVPMLWWTLADARNAVCLTYTIHCSHMINDLLARTSWMTLMLLIKCDYMLLYMSCGTTRTHATSQQLFLCLCPQRQRPRSFVNKRFWLKFL